MHNAFTLMNLAHDVADRMHRGVEISKAITFACKAEGVELRPVERNVVFSLANSAYNEQLAVAAHKAKVGE